MLVSLGFKETPIRMSFPCPGIIHSKPKVAESTSHLEGKAEIEQYIDSRKTVGERATTKRSPGNWS